MNHKRYILAALVFCQLMMPMPSHARWHLPIHPGDHVIDVKRLQDSIQETAQMVQEYLNEAEKFKQKVLLMAGIQDLDKKIDAVITGWDAKLHGQSILSPDIPYASTPMRQPIDMDTALKKESYLTLIHKETEYANQDAVTAAQQSLQQYAQREQQAQDILFSQTAGSVGETQKHAALTALQTLNTGDAARMEGYALLRDITESDAAMAQERIEQQEASLHTWYGYDPYHPTEYDETHAPAIDNFGFLSTKQTE